MKLQRTKLDAIAKRLGAKRATKPSLPATPLTQAKSVRVDIAAMAARIQTRQPATLKRSPPLFGAFTADQEKSIRDFMQAHVSKHKKTGAIGGAVTYEFTPTSLGLIEKIRCFCGETLDLTDYDW